MLQFAYLENRQKQEKNTQQGQEDSPKVLKIIASNDFVPVPYAEDICFSRRRCLLKTLEWESWKTRWYDRAKFCMNWCGQEPIKILSSFGPQLLEGTNCWTSYTQEVWTGKEALTNKKCFQIIPLVNLPFSKVRSADSWAVTSNSDIILLGFPKGGQSKENRQGKILVKTLRTKTKFLMCAKIHTIERTHCVVCNFCLYDFISKDVLLVKQWPRI